MARKFTVTTPAETVRPGANGRAEMVFTVANTGTTPARALVRPVPLGTTKGEWLSIAGEAEREFAAGAVQQFSVAATVPPGTAPGRYPFRIDIISAQRTGEEREEGPTVAVEVAGAAAPAKKSLWWLWVLLALLVIGAVVAFLVLRPKSQEKPPDNDVVTTDPRAAVPRNGIALWLIADDAKPSPGANTIDFWENPETRGPRASAMNIASQPALVEKARNGHAVLRFDGVDDMLKTNVEFGRGRMSAATVFAVFSSMTTDLSTKLRKVYGCDDGGFDPAAGLDTRASTNYGIFTGGGVHPYFNLQANRYYLTSDIWQWTAFSGYVDGKLMIDNQAINSDTNTLPNLYLGGTGPVWNEQWHGDIAEVIVYSRALDAAERQKVEDYLADKYAVKLNR